MKSPAPRSPRFLLAMHSFGQSYMHVPALLGRTGFAVDAVITPEHPLKAVRGLSEVFYGGGDRWAATVEERLLSGNYTCFLNMDEPGLRELYRRKWHPDAAGFLPLPPGSPAAGTVGSKRLFHEWCLLAGLPVPETHIAGSLDEALEIQRNLGGKWLVKSDSGSGGQGVIDPGEEPGPWSHLRERPGCWLVQRDEGRDVGSGIFLADRGRLLAWIGIQKLVCLGGGFGPTVLGQGDASPEVGALCARVAAASGVTGMTGFDFVRNPGSGLLLIDSHLGRMSPMQHFDVLYGVDFAAVLKEWLARGNTDAAPSPRGGPAFIKFPEILELALQGGLLRLFRVWPLGARMPLCPPGDPLTGFRSASAVVTSQVRVNLGRWRRAVFP